MPSNAGLNTIFGSLQKDAILRKLQKQDLTLIAVDLSFCQLTGDDIITLAAALLHNKTVKKLNLAENLLSDADLQVLLPVLPTTAINTLILNDNNLSDAVASALAEILPQTAISELNLQGNNINNGIKILHNSIDKVRSLQLSNDSAIGESFQPLLELIRRKMPTLQELIVGHTLMSKQQRAEILAAAQANGYLQGLQVGHPGINVKDILERNRGLFKLSAFVIAAMADKRPKGVRCPAAGFVGADGDHAVSTRVRGFFGC